MTSFTVNSSNWKSLFPENSPERFTHRCVDWEKYLENYTQMKVDYIQTTPTFFNIYKEEYIEVYKSRDGIYFELINECIIKPGYYDNADSMADMLNNNEKLCCKINSGILSVLLSFSDKQCNPTYNYKVDVIYGKEYKLGGLVHDYGQAKLFIEGLDEAIASYTLDPFFKIAENSRYIDIPKNVKNLTFYFKDWRNRILRKKDGKVILGISLK